MNGEVLIGQGEDRIPTPALVVDMAVMEANMERMRSFLEGGSCRLRAHAKTHKTPMIGRLQMEYGSIGLCCATVSEAEAMVQGGLDHIFVASEVVTREKILRLVSLARYADVMVAVDDGGNVECLSRAASDAGVSLGVLVDVDIGMGRCGVRSVERCVSLAATVHSASALVFRGVFGYEGHAVFIPDRAERERAGRAANALLVEAAEGVRSEGIPVEIVTGGGTGTFDIAGRYAGITEIEAGSYIFMDGRYGELDLPFQQALSVVATVISRPTEDTVIFDVGMKGISVERFCPRVQDTVGITVTKLSEAHANAEIAGGGVDPKPGDRFHLVPSHCCTTVNLYPQLAAVRDGVVEAVWPITGRGA